MTTVRTATWIDADGNRYPLTLDGHALLMAGALGLDAAPIDVHIDERASDGAALGGTRAPSKTIALPLLFDDDDVYETMVENLIGRPTRLEVASSKRTRELIDVYYVGGLEGDADEGKERFTGDHEGGFGPGALMVGVRSWRQRVVELRALDPYWYGPSEEVGLGVPSTPDSFNGAVAFDADIPFNGAYVGISGGITFDDATVLFDSSTIPFDGGTVVTPPITSRVGAWPVFTVKGAATYFSVVHMRTGQRVAFRTTASLPTGGLFTIDSRPTSRSVWYAGVSAWNMVTPDSDPAMQLKVGDSLAVILSGTDANSYVKITWRQRWRMP